MNTMLAFPEPQQLVGTWRRFGLVGPVYEIIAAGEERPDGNRAMKVRILETGEEVEYNLLDILEDPKER